MTTAVPEQLQVNGVRHCLLPRLVWMQMVAAIVSGENLGRIIGILIDECID